MRGLVGRHVVVVGGGGMGIALARSLLRAGAAVSVCDLNPRHAQAAAESGAEGRVLNITDERAVERTLMELAERRGTPWGVCVTAAVVHRDRRALNTRAGDLRALLDVNLLGTWTVDRVAAQLMIDARQGGRILNWSSVNAVGGTCGAAAYAASKAAVESFSQSLAVELAEHAITVNVIRPGSVETPMTVGLDDARKREDRGRIPLGRWGAPEEIAHACQMLLDPAADWITGSIMTVDGGMVAAMGRSCRRGDAPHD